MGSNQKIRYLNMLQKDHKADLIFTTLFFSKNDLTVGKLKFSIKAEERRKVRGIRDEETICNEDG